MIGTDHCIRPPSESSPRESGLEKQKSVREPRLSAMKVQRGSIADRPPVSVTLGKGFHTKFVLALSGKFR